MSAHLLRIELRRNTVLLLLPVLAALAGLSPAWRHLSALALWPARSIDAQTALQGVAPLFAGTAAWVAGRERRRGMADLLATTPRSPWARLLAAWAATTLWGVLLYLLIVAVLLGVTAAQATWGAPVPWPLLVGLLEMVALAALGCALGHGIPSRFTPPLVGVGAFVATFLGVTLVNHGDKIGLLAPGYPSISFSVWAASSADLGVVQSLFLLGCIALGLGCLGLQGRTTEFALLRVVRRDAGGLAVAGLALIAVSVALILSSRVDDGRVWVPLFGGSASAPSPAYTPACAAAALTVCVHPAYQPELRETAALINRIAAPLLGLPGAPTRAEQRPMASGVVTMGRQRVLTFAPIDFHDPTNPPGLVASWDEAIAISLVANGALPSRLLRAPPAAQDAVALYLLRRANAQYNAKTFVRSARVLTAERRFAALPAHVRETWLRAHYTLLRDGKVRLEDVP